MRLDMNEMTKLDETQNVIIALVAEQNIWSVLDSVKDPWRISLSLLETCFHRESKSQNENESC